jgi:hypothetical protein
MDYHPLCQRVLESIHAAPASLFRPPCRVYVAIFPYSPQFLMPADDSLQVVRYRSSSSRWCDPRVPMTEFLLDCADVNPTRNIVFAVRCRTCLVFLDHYIRGNLFFDLVQ